jgi:hypothetical protein
MTHRASAAELAAAEAAEMRDVRADQQVSEGTVEPERKDSLDDSRYMDDI